MQVCINQLVTNGRKWRGSGNVGSCSKRDKLWRIWNNDCVGRLWLCPFCDNLVNYKTWLKYIKDFRGKEHVEHSKNFIHAPPDILNTGIAIGQYQTIVQSIKSVNSTDRINHDNEKNHDIARQLVFHYIKETKRETLSTRIICYQMCCDLWQVQGPV